MSSFLISLHWDKPQQLCMIVLISVINRLNSQVQYTFAAARQAFAARLAVEALLRQKLSCSGVLQAFYLARTGRPGPVLIDVPKDVQQQLAVPDWDVPMAISGYMARLPQQPTPLVCALPNFFYIRLWGYGCKLSREFSLIGVAYCNLPIHGSPTPAAKHPESPLSRSLLERLPRGWLLVLFWDQITLITAHAKCGVSSSAHNGCHGYNIGIAADLNFRLACAVSYYLRSMHHF